MPLVSLIPTQHRQVPTEGVYACPLYKTLTRWGMLSTTGHSTNFIIHVEVPSLLPQKHWIARGVALFTSLR
jgi:dynein heavy chain